MKSLSEAPLHHPKILQPTQLAQRSQQERAQGKTIVFTNGCFDLLHVGHTRYLAAARALGDLLVVGINSDASVRQLKGSGRPIVGQNERAEIIAALESVDFVTIFYEMTAKSIVNLVQPQIYVKGGDYSDVPDSPSFPLEGVDVLRLGGSVRVLPHVAGQSTSTILSKVCDSMAPTGRST